MRLLKGVAMSIITGLLAERERGISGEILEEAFRRLREAVDPGVIDRAVVERYIRKAVRTGAWRSLSCESRSLLLASRFLSKVRSPVLKNIILDIMASIELYTIRGRAIFYGVLLALKQGLVNALSNLRRIITLGIGYLNLPDLWRTLG